MYRSRLRMAGAALMTACWAATAAIAQMGENDGPAPTPDVSNEAYGEEKPVNPGHGVPAPIIHLTFDGSLENRGTFPVPPDLIAGKGDLFAGSANYGEGKIGQSLKLTGKYAVRIPFDLNREAYPQVTVTGWVWSEPGRKQGQIPIIGNNGRILMNLYGNEMRLHAGGGRDAVARQAGKAVPNGRWVFVAGVYNGNSQTTRLHVDTRQQTAQINMEGRGEDGRSLWIGAKTDMVRQGGGDIRVDDIRIYDTALSPEAVMSLYKQGLTAVVRKKPGRTVEGQVTHGNIPDDGGEEQIAGGLATVFEGDPEDTGETAAAEGARTDSASNTRSGPLLETPTSITQPTGITGPVGTPGQEVEEDVAAAKEATPPVLTAPPEFEKIIDAESIATEQPPEAPSGDYETREQALEPEGVTGEGSIAPPGDLSVTPPEDGGSYVEIDTAAPVEIGSVSITGMTKLRNMDLVDSAIHTIRWWEKSDKPCDVELIGSLPGVNQFGAPNSKSLRREFCDGDGGNARSLKSVSLTAERAATGLTFCEADDQTMWVEAVEQFPLKGVGLRGPVIVSSTVLGATSLQQTEDRANCKSWYSFNSCSSGRVMTGVRLGFLEDSTMVAMMPICRPIDN